MIIEDHLEQALIDLLKARTYITAGTIPVREFRDNSEVTADRYVIVHVSPAGRLSPNYPLYKCPVEIICVSYVPADKNRASLEGLYQDVFGFVQALTPASILTKMPSGYKFTPEGIVPDPAGGDEDIQDNFQIMIVKIEVFGKYTA